MLNTLSRLTNLSHDIITGGSANDASWTLAYSPASQLASRTAASALYEWPYSATFNDAYAVNGLNQYTTVAGLGLAYDGRGNTTNDTTKTYTYDSSNLLTSSSNGAVLTYDPTGRLLSTAQGGVTTKFLYDGTRMIAEYNGSNALLRRYIHGDGVDDPIVWYDSTGTTNKRNLFKDERGSVIAADTGSAVTSLKYDEYGNATVSGSVAPRFRYTGQTWLPEIGQYYYKARIYNPDLGRFMQTDPIGTADQVNLYAYVGNDPFNKTDPTGQYECVNNGDGTLTCTTNGSLVDLAAALLFKAAVEAGILQMSGDKSDDPPIAGPGIAKPGDNSKPKGPGDEPPKVGPEIVYPFIRHRDEGEVGGRAPMREDVRPNQVQNRQANDARLEAERKVGSRMTRAQQREFHDRITGQQNSYRDLVDEAEAVLRGE